jgi:hypothetical protein
MGEYGMYKQLLADADLRNATPELSDFFQSKDVGKMGQLHHAMADFNRLRHTEISGIYSASSQEHAISLQSIVPENRAEQTLREVMRILYASVEAISAMNTTQETQLREIALRCPLDDGFGVYMARSALLKLDTLPRNYLSECEQVPAPEETRWKEESVTDQNNGFSVYPNPNNGRMMVAYTLSENESGSLCIYTALGELVMKRALTMESNLMEVDVLGISSGMYLLDIQINGEYKLTERLSIVKE